MLTLIKVEFTKLKYFKSKYILITAFVLMLFIPMLSVYLSLDGTVDENFFSLLYRFYSINYYLVLPLSIGVFILSSVNKEFKAKSIKNVMMTGYSRTSVMLSKFIVLASCSIVSYFITIFIYTLWAYVKSGDKVIYINYKDASFGEVLMNLIQCNIESMFYVTAVTAFAFMLGFTVRKQGISLLIYIFVITIVSLSLNSLQKIGMLYPRYIFTTLSNMEYLGVSGFGFSRIVKIIPAVSNTFLFLAISDFAFKRYEY